MARSSSLRPGYTSRPASSAARGTILALPPFFDSHVCVPPPTSNLLHIDRMAWACQCGRCWHLEWFTSTDGMRRLGPSWILAR